MPHLVVVREYITEAEAAIDAAALEANGIASLVRRSIASSLLPVYQGVLPVRLFVDDTDLEEARKILE